MTTRPSRRPPPRRRHRGRALVVLAVAFVVIGATIGAGALAVRWWWQYGESPRKPQARATSRPDAHPAPPASSSIASWKAWLGLAPRKTAAEASARPERTEKAPSAPVLTFYHDLTAPLVPLPRPSSSSTSPTVARPGPAWPPSPSPGAVRREPMDRRRDVSPEGATTGIDGRRDADDPNGRRFTIQVGAYRTRETADALRARLVGTGQEVYVTESEGPEGVRYRVRVGSFVTQEAARAAAARLASERQIPTYVTTR